MKLRLVLLSLFVSLLLLSTGSLVAAQPEVSSQTQHQTARVDRGGSNLEVVGVNDDDGHAEDEDAHSDGDDGHSDDGQAGDEDAHAAEDDGHGDDHHADGPITWRTFVPLIAGLVGAVIACGVAKMVSSQVVPLDMGIIGLTALTGVLHLVLGLAGSRLLLLNGVGYLGLLALVYLPVAPLQQLRIPLRIILGLYTLVTFVGYFWLHSPAQYDVLAILSKVIEALLIVLIALSVLKTPKRVSG